MNKLFFYGTLRDIAVLEVVLGHDVSGIQLTPATLVGYDAMAVAGHDFPMIQKGTEAEGLLADGLSDLDVERLSYYEGGYLYGLETFEVMAGGQEQTAQVFFPENPAWIADGLWSLEDWRAKDQGLSAEAAREIMSYFGVREAVKVYTNFGTIRQRALARLEARQNSAPVELRSGLSRDDVEVVDTGMPYVQFFAVEENKVRFRHFDGSNSAPADRAVLVAGDAVTVMPYDPVNDLVMLIEQFRAGPFVRGDLNPWSLEPIAGRRDPGESFEDAARREGLEEAGIELKSLEKISSYYPSPGCMTEYILSYIGITELEHGRSEVHGLASEQEDIRTIVITYNRLFEAVESGEIDNGPTLISAYWLRANRDRLRAAAGA